MPHSQTTTIDTDTLMAFVFRAVDEVGAALNCALVVMGDRLGYYRALADDGPMTATASASATGTAEPYAREWLNAQAAGAFVTYEPSDGTYALPPEHVVALTDESSPAFLPGFFQIAHGTIRMRPASSPPHPTVTGSAGTTTTPTCTTAASASSGRATTPTSSPSGSRRIEGLSEKLTAGARVADIGCGHGASTVLMAQAFPTSGSSAPTTTRPRSAPPSSGRPTPGWPTGSTSRWPPATEFSGSGYDLVTTFDALHDMGDPVGAAKRVHEALAPDGVWLLVEPAAGDSVEDNLNPVGPRLLRLLDPALHPGLALAAGGRRPRPRPGRPASATSRPLPASAASASRPRPRSTTSSRCDRDVAGLNRPGAEDTVVRDGIRLSYAVHGSGPATVVLLPSWSIVRSRMWKAQVPFLALRHRVVTFDGRGSGSSDRPAGAAAYANAEYAADTIAVMDAVGADRAVLVGLSSGAAWAARWRPSTPSGCRGSSRSARRPGRSSHAARPSSPRTPIRWTRRWAGPSTTRTTGSTAATTTSSSSSSRRCSTSRTRPGSAKRAVSGRTTLPRRPSSTARPGVSVSTAPSHRPRRGARTP